MQNVSRLQDTSWDLKSAMKQKRGDLESAQAKLDKRNESAGLGSRDAA